MSSFPFSSSFAFNRLLQTLTPLCQQFTPISLQLSAMALFVISVPSACSMLITVARLSIFLTPSKPLSPTIARSPFLLSVLRAYLLCVVPFLYSVGYALFFLHYIKHELFILATLYFSTHSFYSLIVFPHSSSTMFNGWFGNHLQKGS